MDLRQAYRLVYTYIDCIKLLDPRSIALVLDIRIIPADRRFNNFSIKEADETGLSAVD